MTLLINEHYKMHNRENNKKMNITKILVMASLLCLHLSGFSQVTIGSGIPPKKGALLDLKQYDKSELGDMSTANAGLLLPRVELKDMEALEMGSLSIPDVDNAYLNHTGLIVYNVNDEAPFCAGLYVWNGSIWLRVGSECKTLIKIDDKGPWNFSSGQDLREMSPSIFQVSWESPGGSETLTATTVDFLTITPATSSWTAAGTTVTVTPTKMTDDEVSDVAGNPFATKEATYSIVLQQGSQVLETLDILVNQTNKALIGNGRYIMEGIYPPDGVSQGQEIEIDVQIKSNAVWKLNGIYPQVNQGLPTSISNVKTKVDGMDLTSGVKVGEETENNTGIENTLTFKVGISSTNATYSYLLLEDSQAEARFNTLLVPVFQCGTAWSQKQPRMSQWAAAAGFEGVKEPGDRSSVESIATQEDIDAGINTPNPVTGIAWHRDQDGNIFLSSNFGENPAGNDQRWMITNLAAQTFAAQGRTDNTTAIANPVFSFGLRSYFNLQQQLDDITALQMGYAGGLINPLATSQANAEDSRQYDRDPRLGMLYNWTTATMKRASNDGLGTIPGGVTKVQGICPNGWHLPTNAEFTTFQSVYTQKFDTFSSLTSIDGGQLLGRAWKEACQQYNQSTTSGGNVISYRGASNPISTVLRPGFEVILSGFGSNTSAKELGSIVHLWTASTATNSASGVPQATKRFSNSFAVESGYDPRHALFSVRCKMD